MTTPGKIFGLIAACMRDIEAISKNNRNTAQGYNFRGIDDVYNELHPILARHGVFTVPIVKSDRSEERTTAKGSVLIYRILIVDYVFYCEDGSSVTATVIGEGMDSGDKASNKAMAVGHKYAMMQAKDPEVDSHEVKPKTEATRENDRGDTPFDPKNEDHKRWLRKELSARKVTGQLAFDALAAMAGKFEEDLDGVLQALRK